MAKVRASNRCCGIQELPVRRKKPAESEKRNEEGGCAGALRVQQRSEGRPARRIRPGPQCPARSSQSGRNSATGVHGARASM